MATSNINLICSTETLSGWTVRRFSDGTCIATIRKSKALSSGSLWTNNHYANYFSETLPQGLFTSVQYAECQIQNYGIFGWATATTTSIRVDYTVASPNISTTANVLMKVVGRWK